MHILIREGDSVYYIQSNDGTKLCVEDIHPESSKVIVMVHGWPLSKEMFEYQKNMFLDWDFRVISFDIRGFGLSDVNKSSYTYDQLATDLYMLVEHLKLNHFILLGFSMGAAICTHYMGMYDNHHVDKLILVGGAIPSYSQSIDNPHGHNIEETNQLISLLYNDRPKAIEEFIRNMFSKTPSGNYINWINQLCLQASSHGTIKCLETLRDENVWNDLNRIKVPTTIMHGKLDKICPYDFAIIMNQQITNSTLIPFEQSGHAVFYDELSHFNHKLMEFINL